MSLTKDCRIPLSANVHAPAFQTGETGHVSADDFIGFEDRNVLKTSKIFSVYIILTEGLIALTLHLLENF
jgi:hypothetical protein